MSATTIRRYQSLDHDAVVALWEAVLPDTQPHNRPVPVIHAKLAVDDLLFVAFYQQRLVGTAMAGYDGHRGWLYLVAVYPELPRQGIATTLVCTAIEALQTRGCLKFNLQVRAGNEAVIGFYQSLGFDVEARTSMGIRL